MKASVHIQAHTNISPADAPALKTAFMDFVTAARAVGLDIREANLALEEHPDERDARLAVERGEVA